jgi:hypothetical protein
MAQMWQGWAQSRRRCGMDGYLGVVIAQLVEVKLRVVRRPGGLAVGAGWLGSACARCDIWMRC